MAAPQNVIAVIFDFDDTLTDDSTTQLLNENGIDATEFWNVLLKAKIEDGWDPTLAYLTMLLERVGPGKPLGLLTNERLRDFGATLELYQGLPGIFDDLREIAAKDRICNPRVEFYIVSGGLEEVIRGSSIAKHMSGIYGCRFATDERGVVNSVKNVISFTEKTRFIFEINKGLGLDGKDSRTNPYKVNESQQAQNRRVPLENMLYVGDGLTDIPCFSLIQKANGKAFGVFDPEGEGKPKKAWQGLLAPRRVMSLNAPKYRANDDLGALLRAAVSAMCQDLLLRSQMAV